VTMGDCTAVGPDGDVIMGAASEKSVPIQYMYIHDTIRYQKLLFPLTVLNLHKCVLFILGTDITG
jgi:hypothetical protein